MGPRGGQSSRLPVQRFVIDLRGNIGGDAMAVDPLLYGLIRRDAMVLRAQLDHGNAENVAEAFTRFVSRDRLGWWTFEEELRGLGYELLHEQSLADALHVMRLYANAYPEAWNAWDSLGEAQMSSGDRDGAIASYERSLQLNPDNHNAVAKLGELRGH